MINCILYKAKYKKLHKKKQNFYKKLKSKVIFFIKNKKN